MIKKFRNAVLTLTASLLATTALKADDSQKQVRNLENRVAALEQRKSSGGIILPPVYPIVKNGANLGISAELLYWKARQDNDCYAVSWGPTSPNEGPVGKIYGHTPHYKWDTGFRLGLDYGLPHDGWNTTLDWTNIRNTAHASPASGKSFGMVNAPSNGASAPAPTSLVSASQHSKLELDLLDLDLGRAFFTSKWLTLRPFAGLRAAWIDQKFVSTFKSNDQVLIQLTRRNHSKGIGLRAGVDAEWGLGSGFSVFTDGALGLIYTRFEPKLKSLGNEVGEAGSYTLVNNYKKDYYESKLNADLALGLQWERLFSQDRFGLRLRAGWEQHLFVNQGMVPTYSQVNNQIICDSTTGDLSVQGWVFSAKFDF